MKCGSSVYNMVIVTGTQGPASVDTQDAVSVHVSPGGFGNVPETKAELEKQLAITQKSAFAPGTYANLLCQWRAFVRFVNKYKIKEWPCSSYTVCLLQNF